MVKDDDESAPQASSCHQNQHQHQHRNDDDNETNVDDHDDDENSYFESVCVAYRQYANFAMSQWIHREYRLQTLSESQRKLLPADLRIGTPEYAKRSKDYKDAVIRNQFCLDCILRHAGQPHSQHQQQSDGPAANVTDDQVSKVSSVLKSLARDWSTNGKIERTMAYDPIKTLIKKYMPLQPPSTPATSIPRIVVPGSGVGRLAFDLAAMGYSVQGNEFSMYMLLASDFILNNGGSICNPGRPLHLGPWLLESRNVHASTDPLRTVQIPDVDPMSVLMPPLPDDEDVDEGEELPSSRSRRPVPEFSMAAGDFAAIYNHDREAEQWDCVASCFFLDACPNIVELLQVIYKMLKPGGLFVNLGPLLYHWSGPPMRPDDKSLQEYRQRYQHLDDRYFTSIDLCYGDVKEILNNIGFEILEEEIGVECYYTTDQRSMMKTKYQCVSFVAKKTN